MTTRTDYLAGADQIDYRIMDVLNGWITNEASNLDAFINNPVEHVNYNPYVIFDFTKLNERLTMLNAVIGNLNTIIQYKQANPNFTQSMYENSLDQIGTIIFERLLGWLVYRQGEMARLISENGDPNNISPLHDYVGMFTFDQTKFQQEYQMYVTSLSGCQVVVDYKVEQDIANSPAPTTTTTTSTPSQDGPTGTV